MRKADWGSSRVINSTADFFRLSSLWIFPGPSDANDGRSGSEAVPARAVHCCFKIASRELVKRKEHGCVASST